MCAETKMSQILTEINLDIQKDVSDLLKAAVASGYALTGETDGWKPKIKGTSDVVAGIMHWVDSDLEPHEVRVVVDR